MKDGISNLFVFREDFDKKMGKNFEFKDLNGLNIRFCMYF